MPGRRSAPRSHDQHVLSMIIQAAGDAPGRSGRGYAGRPQPYAHSAAASRRNGAAMAAAAAPGSGAPVMGRPMTRRSAPSRSASSGVATRAWSLRSAPAGRTPGVISLMSGPDLGADRGHLARGADQAPAPGRDREHGEAPHGVRHRAAQADRLQVCGAQ